MPVVETFVTSPNIVPGAPAPSYYNPAAEAAGMNALAGAADRSMSVMERFNERYNNARREADSASLQAESMKRLGDAKLRWSKVPDSLTARQGFDTEAEKIKAEMAGRINDPYVALKFAPHFEQMAASGSLDTRGAAFALESSARKGELLTNLNTYSHALAAAGSPLERQQILDTADQAIGAYERGGWIHPEDAAKLRLTTRSKADEVQARQIINADPPLAMQLLGDAKNFPNLDEKTREVLERQAIARADTQSRQRIAAGEKAERQAEHQLKIDQGVAEVKIFGQLDSDKPPSLDQIEAMATRREISPEGYLAARRAILSGELGRDEPNYVNNLHARILTGEASLDEIRGAPLNSISMRTKSQYMDLWANKQSAGPFASRDYKDANDTLRGAIVTTGPGSAFVRTDEQQKLSLARRELDTWMRANKVGADDTARIWEKVDEMLPRYQSAPQSIYGLPRPRLGEVKQETDIDRIADLTAQAFMDGRINEADATLDGQLLNQYRAIFDTQARQEADRKAAADKVKNAKGGKR